MKTFLIACSVQFVLLTIPAMAQNPATPQLSSPGTISPGDLTPTPEMWFYEQYRQEHQDPKVAVRRKAEFRAAQRQRRIAALKWFGFSTARPRVSSDPWHSDYSPGWSSNNSFYPFRWNGYGQPWIVVHREISATQNR